MVLLPATVHSPVSALLNQVRPAGFIILVNPAHSGPGANMRIHITNLPKRITDKDLNELAVAYGKPDSAIVARRITGGESKGFGFIEYFNPEEARAAIAGLN